MGQVDHDAIKLATNDLRVELRRDREHKGAIVTRNHKLFSVLLATGACIAAADAIAVEATDAGTATLQEVVVSAQKRDESLQSVPLSLTTFSQEKLDLMGATNLDGVQQSTPNLDFAQQSGGQNNTRVTVRGIGTETLESGGDPGVALHIDGVYVGRNSAAAIDIFDVQRVEVLRGPQGTLYGRNANGGSINIITRRPQDKLEIDGDLTVGSYNWFRARGVLNVPLADSVAARLAVFSDTRDGYEKNLWSQGRDGGDKDNHGARLQVQWQGDNGNTMLLRGYDERFGGVGPATRFLGADLPTADGYPPVYAIGLSSGPVPPAGTNIMADVYRNPTPAIGDPVLPLPKNLLEIRKDAPEYVDQAIRGVDFEGSWQLANAVLLRSLSSYQTNKNDILVDADNSELPIETRRRRNNAHQFSQEFNLLSTGEGRTQWIFGAYYYLERLTEDLWTKTQAGLVPLNFRLPPGAVPGGGGVEQHQHQNYETMSYALFGQASFKLTDAVKLTAGVRETWDHKKQSRSGGGRIDSTTGILFNVGTVGFLSADSSEQSFKDPTWKLVLDYTFQNENMMYVSYSRGSKAGGFDFNSPTVDGVLTAYEPEKLDAYEVGSKNRLFDDRVQFNVAAFYYDYTNLQTFRLTTFGPRTDNAAASTIKGFEAELIVAATDALRIDASAGYLDAKYDQFFIDIPPPGVDYSGNVLNNAPKWTLHAGAQYTWPVGSNNLLARVDWSYKDDIYFDRANSPLDMQKAYSLVNGRLRYDARKWYVDLFGSNLLDKTYVVAQLINPPFNCGCRTVNVGAPRMYGIMFGVRY